MNLVKIWCKPKLAGLSDTNRPNLTKFGQTRCEPGANLSRPGAAPARSRLQSVEPLPLGIPQAVEPEDQGEQQLGHVVRVHDGLPPARTLCKRSVDQGYRMQI